MNNATKLIIALVVVAAVGVGAFLLTKDDDKNKDSDQTSNTSQGQEQTDEQASEDETVAATITYDGSNFTVSKTTVPAGSKVKVVNNSQDEIEFESNPHPVHTDNSELNAGDIAPGESKTFLLNTKGTWGFHNHYNASQEGEITVE